MTISNTEIASLFSRLADLLEIEGANPFRVRAYRNAARVIGDLSKNIASFQEEGRDLTELPGIGKDLAEKIETIIKTGNLPLLTETEKRVPRVLSELLTIEGLGPKRVKQIYQEFRIQNLEDLKRVIETGQLEKLPRFGAKSAQKIQEGIKHHLDYGQRINLIDAMSIAEPLLAYLKKIPGVKNVECAGSYRRRKETIADLDILIAANNGPAVIARFVKYENVATIISQGDTRSTVRLRSGVQVDLRVVEANSYGAALIYFTGSKAHNIALRKIAIQKKLKINEYGVFKNNKSIAGKTEQEVYQQIDLPFIEPELREDQGEIEAARNNKLPELVTLADIRGDLHCHSKATEANATLETMVEAAIRAGYEYLAITAHSKLKKAVLQQIKAIDKLNTKLKKMTLLKSMEVDILEDGSLDLPEEVLKELDLAVCSVHSHLGLSAKKQTERILRALDNSYCTILAPPTGQLINHREPYAIDLERILHAAKERGCFLEVNARSEHVDLNAGLCKLAKEIQLKLVLSTNALSPDHFAFMRFGVYQARRGWLEKNDIVNTRSLAAVKKLLRKR